MCVAMSVEVKIVAVDFGQLAEARAGLADGAFAAHEVDDIAVAPLGLLGVAFGFGGGLPGGFSGVEGSGAGGGCGLRAGRGRPGQGEETAESGGEGLVVDSGDVVLVSDTAVHLGWVGDVGADESCFMGALGGEGGFRCGAEGVGLGVVAVVGLLVGGLVGGGGVLWWGWRGRGLGGGEGGGEEQGKKSGAHDVSRDWD